MHVPRLPSHPASNVGGWVIDWTGWNWLDCTYLVITRNNLSIIWISLSSLSILCIYCILEVLRGQPIKLIFILFLLQNVMNIDEMAVVFFQNQNTYFSKRIDFGPNFLYVLSCWSSQFLRLLSPFKIKGNLKKIRSFHQFSFKLNKLDLLTPQDVYYICTKYDTKNRILKAMFVEKSMKW